MNSKDITRYYWNKYLLYESEYIKLTQYIFPSKDNDNVYSLKISDLLLKICSSLENSMKQITGIDGQVKMNKYQHKLLEQFPDIPFYKIHNKLMDCDCQPFKEWQNSNKEKVLYFWNSYNSVKHNIKEYFYLANFKSVTEALAGLFCINMIQYQICFDNDTNEPLSYPFNNSDYLYCKEFVFKYRSKILKSDYPLYDLDTGDTDYFE